jgi:hypothetical protein
MEPEGLLQCSHEPSDDPYPKSDHLVHTTPSSLSKVHYINVLPLCLGLPSGLLPSRFSTKILHAFLLASCMLHGKPNPPFFYKFNYTS